MFNELPRNVRNAVHGVARPRPSPGQQPTERIHASRERHNHSQSHRTNLVSPTNLRRENYRQNARTNPSLVVSPLLSLGAVTNPHRKYRPGGEGRGGAHAALPFHYEPHPALPEQLSPAPRAPYRSRKACLRNAAVASCPFVAWLMADCRLVPEPFVDSSQSPEMPQRRATDNHGHPLVHTSLPYCNSL